MTWWAVEVRADAAERDAVAEWLVRRTGQAVEEQPDGRLIGYTTDEPSSHQVGRELQTAFVSIALGPPQAVDPVDWGTAWRAGLGPRTIGRLTILPTWCDRPVEAGVLVRIDPESAFGTGEHGSTRGALLLLDRHLVAGTTVLDLGSGSGILAIAAAALGARCAVGIENDGEAVPVAVRNAEQNGVSSAVSFLQGDAGLLAPLLGPADLILSNILPDANAALLSAIRQALAPEGLAVFSGMEVSEAPLFRASLDQAGYHLVDEVEDTGWWSVAARPR